MITSVCERVRARQVAFSRVWSRLVAFSRANIFFVRARLGVFCRHFSSFVVPKRFFRVWRATGGCGIGWAGRAAGCCAWFPHRGQDVHHVMIFISNRFATAAGPRLRSFVLRTIVLQNRGVCSSWNFQGCIPDYCVSSKAKALKQLRPASTEQSRTERGQRVRDLTRPAHASLFERLPNILFAGRFDSAAADGVTRLPEYVVRTLCSSHSLLIVYPLLSSQIIGTHPFLCDWPAGNGEEEKAEQAVSIPSRFVYFSQVGEAFAGGSFGAGREVENLDREPAGVVEVA